MKILFDSLPQGLARHPGRIATAVSQPFSHQGLLYEPELGQYQNRARQYDPAKRRFLQRDPLTLVSVAGSGTQDGMNLYGYVRGNPMNGLDPTGEYWDCIDCLIDLYYATKMCHNNQPDCSNDLDTDALIKCLDAKAAGIARCIKDLMPSLESCVGCCVAF